MALITSIAFYDADGKNYFRIVSTEGIAANLVVYEIIKDADSEEPALCLFEKSKC